MRDICFLLGLSIQLFIFCTSCSLGTISGLSVLSTATPTASATSIYNQGLWNSEARAVRIFLLTYDGSNLGSFDPNVNTTGVVSATKNDFVADRFYTPANIPLVSAPQWLNKFEIVTNSAPAQCAEFETQNSAALANNCHPGGGNASCGAILGQFRVSEVDCYTAASPLGSGSGSETDGLFLRAIIDRNYLAPYENLLMVLEYTASTIHLPSTDPSNCMIAGNWAPENCVDFIWNVYLRHSVGEAALPPFLMLIPPAFYFAQSILKSDTQPMIQTRQVVIPLAMDSTLSVIQLSRYQAHFQGVANAGFSALCGSGSPLCAGVIFNSITFYRI